VSSLTSLTSLTKKKTFFFGQGHAGEAVLVGRHGCE